jgi:hypothetical protein
MRDNDEDAEKVLLLLHEQLMQEQTARRALDGQLQQAKEALLEAHSERLKQHQQQLLRHLPAVPAVSGTPATPAAPQEYLQLGTPPARSSSKQRHASNASTASNVCARYSVYLLY